MKKVYSDIIQYRGNHYDFGFYQGQLLKTSPILINRKKQWGANNRKFMINKHVVMNTLLKFAPGLLDEIQGLADALQMNTESALREFGGYYLEYGRSGCSIFSHPNYMIRNYDNAPVSYEGRYVVYQPSDRGFATIGPTMQITGRMDGMNEKGLAMGYNFVHRKKSDDGFVCNMIGRIILETCANAEEAISLLKAIPHRHSFNYVLLDRSGDSIIVEASPRRVEIRQGNSCTNHFETLTDENRYRMEESIQRLKSIQNQENMITDIYSAYQMMNSTEKGIFSKKYGAWAGTLHTASYLPKEMKVWFALGGDQMPLIIDFQKWLLGEKLRATKVKGKLDTNSPFVNMEII